MNPGKVFRHASVFLIALLLAAPLGAFAAVPADGKPFKQEQLDQMLAPIALYPDALLAQVLMAATYPLEVVQADRWVKQNSKLRGAQLNAALDKKTWDPSVKALAAFPDVLAIMSDQLDWTQNLGDAFLAQQADVMETVQKLRARAQAQNSLKSTKEQKVIVEEKIIRIEPANPEVIYIPAYNPTVVYGPWPYPAYPPVYYGPPVVAPGLSFVAGVAVGAAFCSGWGAWGWGNNTINVNINNFPPPPPPHHGPGPGPGPGPHPGPPGPPGPHYGPHPPGPGPNNQPWQHDPSHRKGVAYRDDTTKQKYAHSQPGSPDARRDYRGHTPDDARKPSRQQAGPQTPGRKPSAQPSQAAGMKPAGAKQPAGATGSRDVGARQPAGRTVQQQPEARQPSVSPGSRQPAGMQPAADMPRNGAGTFGHSGEGYRSTAFEGMGHGSASREFSDRGRASREGARFGGGGGGFRGRR